MSPMLVPGVRLKFCAIYPWAYCRELPFIMTRLPGMMLDIGAPPIPGLRLDCTLLIYLNVVRSAPPALPPTRKLLLGLLTWTRMGDL